MSHSMVYYYYSGRRPKLQEWKKYYDCSKLCLHLDPQTIFLQFYSTDQSLKHLWIHFLWAWWTSRRKRTTLKAVISAFQALVPTEWNHTNYCIAVFNTTILPGTMIYSFGNFLLENPKRWTCPTHKHWFVAHWSQEHLCKRYHAETVVLLELLCHNIKLNALGKTKQKNEAWNLLPALTHPIINLLKQSGKQKFFINNPNQNCAAETEKSASSTNFRMFYYGI